MVTLMRSSADLVPQNHTMLSDVPIRRDKRMILGDKDLSIPVFEMFRILPSGSVHTRLSAELPTVGRRGLERCSTHTANGGFAHGDTIHTWVGDHSWLM